MEKGIDHKVEDGLSVTSSIVCPRDSDVMARSSVQTWK